MSFFENRCGRNAVLNAAASAMALAWACTVPAAFAQATGEDEAVAAEPGDAATDPTVEAAPTGTAEPIFVTATRTRSEFEAPTATQIIGVEELEAKGASNVFDVIEELPAFNTRLSPAANGVRTQNVGQAYADLRGLGSSRTLVLVNNRRFVPVVPTVSVGNPYQVDLNLIPSLMVERIDVVTGGASAQWGSDAVAGVLNMILRDEFDGIKVEAQSGISQRGDGENFRLGAVAGFDFGGGRGNVVVSGDYVVDKGIDNYMQRDWADDFYQFYTDPSATFENGQPRRVLRSGTQPGDMTPGGLIISTGGLSDDQNDALVGLQFDSPTAVSPFVFGEFNQGRFTANQAGGAFMGSPYRTLVASRDRLVFYGLANYEISDNLMVYLEGSWGKSKGESINMPIRDRTGIYNPVSGSGSRVRIYADNPYIPDAIRDSIPAPDGPSSETPPDQFFTLGRIAYDYDQPNTHVSDTAFTVSTGLEGDLSDAWSWDASFTYGQNEYYRQTFNMRDRALYALAADAVIDPDSGEIVCRSTLTDPTNGCVPVNLFGEGTPSQAAKDYYLGTPWAKLDYTQRAFQANLRGEPFSTWAGPVAVAMGFEYRDEDADASVDEISPLKRWDLNLGAAFEGDFNVKEGYFEATVPLTDDVPFARSLTVNGAVRYADYSSSGGVTTWKVGGTWEPTYDILFRASHSLDIRAPSVFELYSPSNSFINNVVYQGVTYGGVLIETGGNLNLDPEESKTTTLGVALTPSFLPGLRFSADYYDIKVTDVIDTVGQAEIARLCGVGVEEYCDLITFNQSGAPIIVENSFINLSELSTSGIDFVGSYSTDLGKGALDLRLTATYVDSFRIVVPGAPDEPARINEQAGQHDNTVGAVPHWRGNMSATYSQDAFSLRGTVRYVGPGVFDNAATDEPADGQPRDYDPDFYNIGDYFVFGIGGTINFASEGNQFFWNVENLFDRDPPLIPHPAIRAQTNAQFYDVNGRYFRVGMRLRF